MSIQKFLFLPFPPFPPGLTVTNPLSEKQSKWKWPHSRRLSQEHRAVSSPPAQPHAHPSMAWPWRGGPSSESLCREPSAPLTRHGTQPEPRGAHPPGVHTHLGSKPTWGEKSTRGANPPSGESPPGEQTHLEQQPQSIPGSVTATLAAPVPRVHPQS